MGWKFAGREERRAKRRAPLRNGRGAIRPARELPTHFPDALTQGRAHITVPSTVHPSLAIARIVESLVLKRWFESLRGKPLL